MAETIESRVTRLETDFKYLATHSDIKELRIWILSGIVAALVAIIGAAVGITWSVSKLLVEHGVLNF